MSDWDNTVSVVDALLAIQDDIGAAQFSGEDDNLEDTYLTHPVNEEHVCQGMLPDDHADGGHIDEMLRHLLTTGGQNSTLNDAHDTSGSSEFLSNSVQFNQSPKKPVKGKRKRKQAPPEPSACIYCQKVFARKTSLYEHVRAQHYKEDQYSPDFSCLQCDAVFKHKRSLNRHSKTIHGNMKYRCNECGKNFSSTSSLKVHTLTIHSKMVYRCGFCDKIFYSVSTVRIHEREMHPRILDSDCNATERRYHYRECIDETKDRNNDFPNVVHEIVCAWCPLKLKSSILYDSHVRAFHAEESQLDHVNVEI
eukprot:sb/3467176/